MNPDNAEEAQSSMHMAPPEYQEQESPAVAAPEPSATQSHSSVAVPPPAFAEDLAAKANATSSAAPGSTEVCKHACVTKYTALGHLLSSSH